PESNNVELANAVRKILTLTGRDLLPADYEADYLKTKPGATYHLAPVAGSSLLSSQEWNWRLNQNLKNLSSNVVDQMLDSGKPNEMHQWWNERWGWNPSGSSSLRQRLQPLKDSDDRLRSNSRPNKRTVAEDIDLAEVEQLLGGLPTGVSRVSTKPEPGYKRRTLYAIDDWGHYIASYASAEIEKNMNMGGMVAKQTPEDVLEWYMTDIYNHQSRLNVWLSLDYSDFNKDHDRRHLTLLNKCLGDAWLLKSRHRPDWILASRQRAATAYHTALEHLNAWVRMPDGSFRRHYNGLWSGHRDTARDNTMMHYAYSKTISDILLDCIQLRPRHKYLGICGDDEDGLHDTWVHAAAYVGMHTLCGFSINYTKQRCSSKYHEFLQRFAGGTKLPFRPIANVIAAISTGSWYKASMLRLDSTAQELTQNCTELLSRGAPPRMARRLAYKMLDALYTIKDPKSNNTLMLDWWPVRYGGTGKRGTLWGLEERDITVTWDKPVLTLPKEAPQKASQAWLETKWQLARHLTSGQLAAYKQHLIRENYKSLYADYLTRLGIILNLDKLPTITKQQRQLRNRKLNLLPEPPKHEATQKLLLDLTRTMGSRQPITKDRLLAAFKIDGQLFEMLGGWPNILPHLPVTDLAKYIHIPKLPDGDCAWLDNMEPAFANKLKLKNMPQT
ncbi:RNA-dependent RNA polymerase, partial [viral metagenome]